ncbi:MAG: hypothetical protein M1820_008587 [Bogoriella megaspora]|nr:MAG: hypothetical protein M1820_008587 [Bogoriella megaspora]
MPHITFYDSNSEMVGISPRRTDASEDSVASTMTDGERSYKSRSTAPTEYSTLYTSRSPDMYEDKLDYGKSQTADESKYQDDPRSSVETYASTNPSEEDLVEVEGDTVYEIPEYRHEAYGSGVLPATPADFAELFPSSRRLTIHHDDTTLDGNMNLRIDTQVTTQSGRKQDLQLFHFRMHDIKNREFSFRRYCRESGREVCHSVRKYQKPAAEKRPTFSRSLTNTITGPFRSKSDNRAPTASNLKRNDSGYASMAQESTSKTSRPPSSDGEPQRGTCVSLPTNTTKLEFSNYAQVDVKRRGTKNGKRYEFDYWGNQYSWKRTVKKDGPCQEISYHLMQNGSDQSIARIVPEVMSNNECRDEKSKGGWIPPCSMWITDEKVFNLATDASDVIVATGMIALVDDCIKRRFHASQNKRVLVSLPSRKQNLEFVGPKRLVNETFSRPSSRRSASGY